MSRPRENPAKLLNSKAVGNILGKSVKFEIDKNVPNDADRASETASSFLETIQESTQCQGCAGNTCGECLGNASASGVSSNERDGASAAGGLANEEKKQWSPQIQFLKPMHVKRNFKRCLKTQLW